ncbi:hypothetical protein PPBDW_I21155 [Photobacterium kishitanii]|nr:hypothetical protein PPBDW_I21155 [Photobacterium kishitanii]
MRHCNLHSSFLSKEILLKSNFDETDNLNKVDLSYAIVTKNKSKKHGLNMVYIVHNMTSFI